ncbi:MAG: TatD DNase family protein [Fimbriimonadaceae bacterium]|jgi:TatD DNase family protein|nr:TatD DNase family protein [Fimbriimonadaceae bacterium]
MLIDTHCHLNLADAFPDPAAAIKEAKDNGVGRMIVIGIDIPTSRRALEIADANDGVYAVAGVHPNSAAEYYPEHLREIEEMLKHPKVVAIGEIGLDYHWDHASRDEQAAALLDQLDLAHATGKPVVFHCREAYSDLLAVVEARNPSKWLFHCFSGSEEDARRAMALDAYFGVDGPITYPKAGDLRSVVAKLPKDRLVVETDAPYLSPEPFRGKPNKPANVRFVNAALAACLGIGEEECAALTTANAERFFGIGE